MIDCMTSFAARGIFSSPVRSIASSRAAAQAAAVDELTAAS
jgi:hypothetical protein